MTATTEPVFTIERLDPRGLVAHPRNVRTSLGDLEGLTASILEQGVLEPLVVVPVGHQHVIIAGHRRAAAAIAADVDRVPCIVRFDLSTDSDSDVDAAVEIAAMLAENIHRENLSVVEEARGVQAMLDLGVPIAKVAKATGLPAKRVAKAAGVARLDDDTAAAVTEHQLDLDQAAAVALFADDPDAAADLLDAAADGPGEFAHALERAKQQRDDDRELAKMAAELRAAGRTVIDGPYAELPPGTTAVHQLADGDGKALDEDEHAASCPGAAVRVVVGYGGTRSQEMCTNPGRYGHVDRWSSQPAKVKPETAEEKDAAKAERRRVIENNKAMQAANVVRREWLRSYLQQRTAPKELLRFVADSFAIPRLMDSWLGGLSSGAGDHDAHKLLGLAKPSYQSAQDVTLTTGEQVTDARLPLQLFAHVAAAHENAISRESWRPNTVTGTANTARWLRFLTGQGYTLSDVEQEIVDGADR